MENEFYRDYKDRVVPALRERHKYKNVHQIPRVEKVVVNTSVGSQADLKQAMEEAKTEIALITGQLPAETRAKKSIANFKLRKDQIIGAKVTFESVGNAFCRSREKARHGEPVRRRTGWESASRLNFMSTVTDPIADLLARMRNGAHAEKIEIFVPYSKLKAEVVRIFKTEG